MTVAEGRETWKDDVLEAVLPSLFGDPGRECRISNGGSSKGDAAHQWLGQASVRCLLQHAQRAQDGDGPAEGMAWARAAVSYGPDFLKCQELASAKGRADAFSPHSSSFLSVF